MATAAEFIAAAEAEVGTTESPAGSNRTEFAAEAGHANGAPWCMTFIVAIARRVDLPLESESAYTPTVRNAYAKAGRLHAEPKPGDIAFFDFPDAKRRVQHVGIVVSSTPKTVTCVEGNTSPGNAGSQDNGGGVYRRTRPRAHVVGFGRPIFAASTSEVRNSQEDTPMIRIVKDGRTLYAVFADGRVERLTDGNVVEGWRALGLAEPTDRTVGTKPGQIPPDDWAGLKSRAA